MGSQKSSLRGDGAALDFHCQALLNGMRMHDFDRYWFPAKKVGWGWGTPRVWQGKLVLALFYMLVGVGAFTILPHYGPATFVGFCIILCAALVAVCWIKGEPPRWRRGGQ